MKRSWVCAVALLSIGWSVSADIVTLKNGGKIEGNVVREDDKVVEVVNRFGKVTLPREDVVAIEEAPTVEEAYAEKAAALAPGDAGANLLLADWARANGMDREAVRHYIEADRLDPALARAAQVLESMDWHRVGGEWVDADTYYRGIGWVRSGLRWISPQEHGWHLAEEDTAAAERQAKRARKTLEDARDGVARSTAAEREKERAEDLMDDRVRSAEDAVADERARVTDAVRRAGVARLEVQRAQATYDLERIKKEKGEPNQMEQAHAALQLALQAAKTAEHAVSRAEERVRTQEKALARVQSQRDAAARAVRTAADKLEDAEAEVGKAEADLAAAEAEVEEARTAEQKAKAAFEEERSRR